MVTFDWNRHPNATTGIHVACWRQPLTPHQSKLPEYTMFADLIEKLGNLLEHAEHARRDAYLASSADLCELEHRMRSIEINGYLDPSALDDRVELWVRRLQ
jgi:hypothetical protein